MVKDISDFGEFNRAGDDDNQEMFFYSVAPTTDTTMTDYVRDSRGQWPLDLTAEDPSRVDLWLETPAGPYRISLEITVDGKPFRTFQEQGIIQALDPKEVAKVLPVENEQPTIDKPLKTVSATTAEDANDADAPQAASTENRITANSYRRSRAQDKLSGYLKSQPEIRNDYLSHHEELQWMVSQWVPGGRILVASPRFGLQHASSAPLLNLLSDEQWTISSEQLSNAKDTLLGINRDGNSLVTLPELEAAKSKRKEKSLWRSQSLLHLEPSQTSVDLAVKLDLEGQSATCKLGDDTESADTEPKSDRIEVKTPFGFLEVLPVIDSRTGGAPLEAGQFSIGAMLLPQPLWAISETHRDGQLDITELYKLPNALRQLDLNQDDQVTPDEIPMRIRLVVSQGPWANRLLGHLATVVTPVSVVPESVAEAPLWFTGMDSNGDRLLSRSEFLSSDDLGDQFKELDRNGDGAISVAEAAAVEQ